MALWVGASMAQLSADADAKESAADGVVDVGFALRTTLNDAATLPDDGAALSFPEAQEQGVPLRDLVRARDTGEPTLSETGVVIVARYGTPGPPPDVAARRQAITAVLVVPVPLRSVLADIAPDDGGIAVLGPERPVAQAPTPVPPGAVSHSVDLPPTLVTGWTVLTWSPDPGVPAAAWAAALALLLAGLGAAGLIERRSRLAGRAAADLARDRSHQETLASLAAVAQRSLDLAEVLPAVATQLSDALGLRGLRLSDPAASADRSLFVTGQVGEVAHGQPLPPAPGGRGVDLDAARSRWAHRRPADRDRRARPRPGRHGDAALGGRPADPGARQCRDLLPAARAAGPDARGGRPQDRLPRHRLPRAADPGRHHQRFRAAAGRQRRRLHPRPDRHLRRAGGGQRQAALRAGRQPAGLLPPRARRPRPGTRPRSSTWAPR